MLDSQAGDKTDDEIELDARKNMAGSSTGTSQRQFHCKNEKRKKNNTDRESDTDSGESEKEDVVMDNAKEDKIKVLLFSYLCNACAC